MKFITIAASFFFFAVSGAIASPSARAAQDVFVPPILTPTTGTVWLSGENQTVTWDISNAPPPNQVTNRIGLILLRKNNLTTPLILSHGFDILSGAVNITAPIVVEGSDYQITLFGDSGDISNDFTITGSGVAN